MKQVYTLDDLASRAQLDAGCDKPARLAVIGHPISHSASPRMHQAALDAMGIHARYVRIDIEPSQVANTFARMRALGFIGCNVTVPHKLEAMACCDVSPEALALGAVNTIRFDHETTRGFNTDGPGFSLAIEEEFKVRLESLNVLIAGAGGGAGQAIATQCCLQSVRKLTLVNRSLDKLVSLSEKLHTISPNTEIQVLSFDDPALVAASLSCDLIVNTSSVGLKLGDPSILPPSNLTENHLVYDTIYHPKMTPLLIAADRAGCKTANGLSMLIHQGALAFQHWFAGTSPLAVMRDAMHSVE